MSFDVIRQLLDNGFSADEVLGSLMKTIPKIAKKAGILSSGGWMAKDILNLFSKDRHIQKALSKGIKPVTPGEIAAMRLRDSYNNIAPTQEQETQGELQSFTKKAAPLALAAATPLVAPMATAALSRALPSSLASNLPVASQVLQQGLQQPVQATGVEQPPQNQQVAPQATQGIAQNANLAELIEKSPLKGKIDQLMSGGNDPTQVLAYFQKFHPQKIKQFEKETGQKFEQAIADYASQKPSTNLLPESTESVATPQKIEKSSIVASPQGVGEVKEIRNGKAIVEVDGKKHQVDEDDLIQSPLAEKDLADLYEDVLRGVETETGEDVSRAVNFAGYDPNTNTLAFLPHTGALYTYENISPEDVELLTDILSTRKTSGQNFIGAWKAGSKSPIGAAMSVLIKRLQSERGGKGNEYSNKFETVYSALEPAILAKKEKERKQKKK